MLKILWNCPFNKKSCSLFLANFKTNFLLVRIYILPFCWSGSTSLVSFCLLLSYYSFLFHRCIPPVLHPTCPSSHLSVIQPVLHIFCLYSTCPASLLSCIQPVLHPTCPNVIAKDNKFTDLGLASISPDHTLLA